MSGSRGTSQSQNENGDLCPWGGVGNRESFFPPKQLDNARSMINPKCPEMSNRAVSLSGTLQEDTEQDDSDPPSPVAATGKTPVVELDCN